jgi:hypothetical protein
MRLLSHLPMRPLRISESSRMGCHWFPARVRSTQGRNQCVPRPTPNPLQRHPPPPPISEPRTSVRVVLPHLHHLLLPLLHSHSPWPSVISVVSPPLRAPLIPPRPLRSLPPPARATTPPPEIPSLSLPSGHLLCASSREAEAISRVAGALPARTNPQGFGSIPPNQPAPEPPSSPRPLSIHPSRSLRGTRVSAGRRGGDHHADRS